MKKISSIISLCFYLCSSAAIACSCGYSTLAEKVSHSENIYIVETYQVETIKPADPDNFVSGERRAYFKVLETLKGSSADRQFIQSAEEPICCMCQSKVKNNTQYLVFNSGDREIHLGTCGFTREVSETAEISEMIKAMVKHHKPTENFTGIYVLEKELFLNDDGTQTGLVELRRDDYFATMSRVSFEGLKLPGGKVMVVDLQEEETLSQEEIKVVEESLNNLTLSQKTGSSQ